MNFIMTFLLLIPVLSFACVDEVESKFEPFLDVKADPIDGLDVTIFIPSNLRGAEISGVSIFVKDEEQVQFTIHSTFLLTKDFRDYEKWKGAAFVNFGMVESLFHKAHIAVTYSYPPTETGYSLGCGPHKVYELKKLSRKKA